MNKELLKNKYHTTFFGGKGPGQGPEYFMI